MYALTLSHHGHFLSCSDPLTDRLTPCNQSNNLFCNYCSKICNFVNGSMLLRKGNKNVVLHRVVELQRGGVEKNGVDTIATTQ